MLTIFIQLHTTAGTPVIVNSDNIGRFFREGSDRTAVHWRDGNQQISYYRETPNQILALIEQERKRLTA